MNFYQPPLFYPFPYPQGPIPQDGQLAPDANLLNQQSYIENILRLNIGKVATVYMNFEGSQWGSKIFKGVVLQAGKDHIILKDLQSEVRYILLMIYLSYITFDESIEYSYPYRKKKKES